MRTDQADKNTFIPVTSKRDLDLLIRRYGVSEFYFNTNPENSNAIWEFATLTEDDSLEEQVKVSIRSCKVKDWTDNTKLFDKKDIYYRLAPRNMKQVSYYQEKKLNDCIHKDDNESFEKIFIHRKYDKTTAEEYLRRAITNRPPSVKVASYLLTCKKSLDFIHILKPVIRFIKSKDPEEEQKDDDSIQKQVADKFNTYIQNAINDSNLDLLQDLAMSANKYVKKQMGKNLVWITIEKAIGKSDANLLLNMLIRCKDELVKDTQKFIHCLELICKDTTLLEYEKDAVFSNLEPSILKASSLARKANNAEQISKIREIRINFYSMRLKEKLKNSHVNSNELVQIIYDCPELFLHIKRIGLLEDDIDLVINSAFTKKRKILKKAIKSKNIDLVKSLLYFLDFDKGFLKQRIDKIENNDDEMIDLLSKYAQENSTLHLDNQPYQIKTEPCSQNTVKKIEPFSNRNYNELSIASKQNSPETKCLLGDANDAKEKQVLPKKNRYHYSRCFHFSIMMSFIGRMVFIGGAIGFGVEFHRSSNRFFYRNNSFNLHGHNRGQCIGFSIAFIGLLASIGFCLMVYKCKDHMPAISDSENANVQKGASTLTR